MAQQIACDLCGTEPAVLLQTKVDSGEVMAVGPACVFPFALGMATVTAAEFTPEVAAVYLPEATKLYNALADLAATETTKPAPVKRKAKTPPVQVTAVTDEHGRDTGETAFIPAETNRTAETP
jgi:hypothetical protein